MKKIKNILIKVSGDLIKNPKTLTFIRNKAKDNYVVVLVGGGTEISNALSKSKVKSKFTEAGRVISNFRGRQIARNILEKNQCNLQNKLIREGINAVVEKPAIDWGGLLCHFNGDDLAEAVSVNFDETHVITRKGRKKKLKGHNLKIIKI